MSVAPPPRRRLARSLSRTRPAIAAGRVPAPAAFLLGGWALLLVAWAIANPPFMAPDEPAHYLRAIAVGHGELAGKTLVTVDERLWAHWRDPEGATCNAGRAELPAACVVDVDPLTADTEAFTSAGAYPPLYYVLPGAALRAGDDVFTALRLARVAGALLAFALLALAVALLVAAEAPRVSLLGLVVAVTPMVIFVASSLNPSGLEIPAGIAFFAALLRLARGPAPPWVWAAAIVAAVPLAWSRAPGMLWIGIDVLLVAAFAGPHGALRIVRSAPRWAVALGGVLVAAVVANRLWEQSYGNEITQTGVAAAPGETQETSVRFWLWHGVQQLGRTFDEQVGVFGWLDTFMPNALYPAWHAVAGGLIVLALVCGRRRDRWLVAAAIAILCGVTVLASATLVATTGMDVQGRHVLPLAVVVPLLAGEILYRNRARLALLDLGALFTWVAALAAFLHAVAWYANAYRHSVGTEGPRFFLFQAEWSPPLGWAPWLVLALLGSALLALAAFGRPALPRWGAGGAPGQGLR